MNELQKQVSLQLATTGNKTYDGHIRRFSNALGGRAVSKETIAEYLAGLAKDKRAATVSNYKFAIKKALSLRIKNDIERAALDALFSDLKIAKADKKVTSLKVIDDNDMYAIRAGLHGVYSLAYEALQQTGLRVSELVNIKRKDCKLTKTAFAIRVLGKGKKERTVFFTHDLFYKIENACKNKTYLFSGRNGGRLYRENIFVAFAKAGGRTGVHVSPHKLRHTFATKQIKARGSVKAVSLYLGHASTATTENMYVHDELTAQQALRFAV